MGVYRKGDLPGSPVEPISELRNHSITASLYESKELYLNSTDS